MPKGPGQPPKPADEKAISWLQVRVRRADKAKWVKAAQREHMNLSQWVVSRLNAD